MSLRARQSGFSYMEIMVAVLLLGICAAPMFDAIRSGTTAGTAAGARAHELRCMKNTMEAVLAMPYQHLWNATPGLGTPAALSLQADTACNGLLQVVLAAYEYDASSNRLLPLPPGAGSDRLESPLLHVTVRAAASGRALTTLVAR